MINFRCKYCNQKISVPVIQAGKKGKCPKCKNMLLVPQPEETNSLTGQNSSGCSTANSKKFHLTLLDVPQKDTIPIQPETPDSIHGETIQQLQELEEKLGLNKVEPVPKRKLPWLIDIFLYPVNKPCLVVVAIIIVIPLLINIATVLAGPFGFFISVPGVVIKIVVGLYMYWYLCECIRDSAAGGLRAPEVLGNAPELGDMAWQTLRIIVTLAFFFLPVLLYYRHTRREDVLFWSLLGYAVVFFPMGLLAVIMFDSFSALNPMILISSIFSTFFQYCGLIVAFAAVGLLVAAIVSASQNSPVLTIVVPCGSIYLTMIAAHLLGRFYWRWQEKLYWEV